MEEIDIIICLKKEKKKQKDLIFYGFNNICYVF